MQPIHATHGQQSRRGTAHSPRGGQTARTLAQRCSRALTGPVSTPSPHSQTHCASPLHLPWYLGHASCRPYTPRRRRCRQQTCRRLPPRSRATRLSQFPPHHSLLSLSVAFSPPPIRSRDTTRACHHIGILAECTRACHVS